MAFATIDSSREYMPRSGVTPFRNHHPEIRLWTAVIALAISDAIISDKAIERIRDREKKERAILDRRSARRFFCTRWFAQVCGWVDVEPMVVLRAIAKDPLQTWIHEVIEEFQRNNRHLAD